MQINNASYNKALILIKNPYLTIIASNEVVIMVIVLMLHSLNTLDIMDLNEGTKAKLIEFVLVLTETSEWIGQFD